MKKNITDYDLNNKRVVIRVDFNVPIKDGVITDDTRIRESLKTINYAIDNNAKVILLSHLGRVKTEDDKIKNTLAPVAKRLSELLKQTVYFANELDFNKIRSGIAKLNNKEVLLLENTRYFDLDGNKESGNDLDLAKDFASLGDIFINDAFGTIHRGHASNAGIASLLPNGVGFLVEKELNELSYLNNPERPYTVILGGSKVSDKIKVIENLVTKCDNLVIGGAMAFTFLKAKGIEVGVSKVEDDYLDFCKDILSKYENKIVLPVDVNTNKEIKEENNINKDIYNLDKDDMGLDLGINTISIIKNILNESKTVFWNGPLGYYELPTYMNATKTLLEYLVDNNIKTILGGGDIVACSSELGLKDKVYHASTGGGATLEYLEGKELPGLIVIQDKE